MARAFLSYEEMREAAYKMGYQYGKEAAQKTKNIEDLKALFCRGPWAGNLRDDLQADLYREFHQWALEYEHPEDEEEALAIADELMDEWESGFTDAIYEAIPEGEKPFECDKYIF